MADLDSRSYFLHLAVLGRDEQFLARVCGCEDEAVVGLPYLHRRDLTQVRLRSLEGEGRGARDQFNLEIGAMAVLPEGHGGFARRPWRMPHD